MKKIFTLGILAALFFTSCDKMLDKNPSTSTPSDDAVTSVATMQYAVNGVYYTMTDVRGTYAGDFPIFADLRGGDMEPWDTYNQISPVAFYQVDKNHSIALDFYRSFYTALARVNKVMDQASKIEVASSEQATYDQLMGELYALRALFHFDLARLYAKIPTTSGVDINAANSGIVLSTAVYPADYIGERATLKATYDQILSDINAAVGKLGSAKIPGHINLLAAKALEARVNLYYGRNNEALAAANAVIESGSYTLYTPTNYLNVWGAENTSESILEILTTTLYNAQRNSVGYYTNIEGYAEAAVSAQLEELLDARPNDIRSQMIGLQVDGDYSGMFINKYPGRTNNLYLNNPKIFRLSEMYLIAAEAKLKGATGGATAADYINTLRQNRITGYTDVTTVTLDDILTERRLELFGEGHYAWDFWRNSLPVTNAATGKTYEPSNYMAILPMPQTEIEVSQGKLAQNPNY